MVDLSLYTRADYDNYIYRAPHPDTDGRTWDDSPDLFFLEVGDLGYRELRGDRTHFAEDAVALGIAFTQRMPTTSQMTEEHFRAQAEKALDHYLACLREARAGQAGTVH